MATARPFTSSACNHRHPHKIATWHPHADVAETGREERDDLLLRWGLFQTYGADLLAQTPVARDEPLRTLPERLAALLITQSADQNGSISGLRLQTIADYLGAYRETIAAILRAFARQDFVALGRGRIDILDFAAMRDLAGIYEWEEFGEQGKERHVQMHLLGAQ